MFKRKIFLLLNLTSVVTSACITNFAHASIKKQTMKLNQNLQHQSSSSNLLTNFNFQGFEADNNNAFINFSPIRKKANDILRVSNDLKRAYINLHSDVNSPLLERRNVSFNELHKLQRLQNHLHRISSNSVSSYHQFAQQVLAINSPGYYKNSAEIISDFENVELRDGVKVQMDLKTAFGKAGQDSQNIVNMYNYFSRFYGKEHMKRWLFTLLIRDDFADVDEKTLGVTALYGGLGAQFVSLKTKSFNRDNIAANFNAGWFTSNNSASTFVHEYGHVLENALQYLPGQINTNFLPSNKFLKSAGAKVLPLLSPWADKDINQDINHGNYQTFFKMPLQFKASEEFVKFIASKLGFDKEQINLETHKESQQHYTFINANAATITSYIVAQLFVDGNYGKTMLMEQFAEMFAYWLWKPTVQTDSSKYSIRWTVINEFFLDYLPKAYKAKIKS